MVLQLQFRPRLRAQNLIAGLAIAALAAVLSATGAQAQQAPSGAEYLRDAQRLYQSGQFFKAARYAFAASENDPSLQAQSYSWITLGLAKAGLNNAAAYFFVRTLQTGDRLAIRRVLTQTEPLLVEVGGDLLRKYLIRHTRLDDYDTNNRGAYLYSLGKDALLSGEEAKAIGFLNGIPKGSPVYAFGLQLRGSAHAILGQNDEALRDFRDCASRAGDTVQVEGRPEHRVRQSRREALDLEARCIAGEARTLYQMERFEEADQTYDRIQKASLVWPDVLFEQAWNSFGRSELNRTLGKLVSYKSPALSFVFNSEVDVLRAQSFLALCLYDDANAVINEFNGKYAKVGEEVKRFVQANSANLPAMHEKGKAALRDSLYTRNEFHRMLNRFVRGPYFQGLVSSERDIERELAAIRRFDATQPGVEHNLGKGFPGFLAQVLRWRTRSIELLGGAYVKNSLLDHHSALIGNFEKMAFIKLEMLRQAKDKLLNRTTKADDRSRGNVEPSRRDYQYYWSFNGEFWNDELGDYVFGLESQCTGSKDN